MLRFQESDSLVVVYVFARVVRKYPDCLFWFCGYWSRVTDIEHHLNS